MSSNEQAIHRMRFHNQHIVSAQALGIGLVLAGCIGIETQEVDSQPTESLEPICHEEESSDGCWMPVEDTSNCHIWIDRTPSEGETASFDGEAKCPGEKFSGSGTVTFAWEWGRK